MLSNKLSYKIGPLLYMPANQENVVKKIENDEIKHLSSICFCLEDTIEDDYLEDAERILKNILEKLMTIDKLPLIFIRIRNPEHLIKIHKFIGECESIVCGYVLPKFDLNNIDDYIGIIKELTKEKLIYFMPILESRDIANCALRRNVLLEIYKKIKEVEKYILNIRVGANDLCNIFGLRRKANQTIYDVGVVRDALIDILSVFSPEYVVSGPVCEYIDNGNYNWDLPLKSELELDVLNGFLGKTCIHPSQLPYVFNSLKVEASQYNDAIRILNWVNKEVAVEKSTESDRMNEKKCSINWANKIKMLAEIYGVKE